MKMFLTRMGANSKAVITGDITQIDLPNPRKSGWWTRSTCWMGGGDSVLPLADVDVIRQRWCSGLCAL